MCFWLHAHTYMHVECMIVTKQCYILGILQTCICNIKFIIKCIRVWKSNGLYSDYGKNSQDHFSFKGRDKKCHSQPEIQKNWKYYHDNTKLVARFSISIKPARKSRAGSGQSPTRNLARGPLFLSGPTRPGPHFCRPVVARGNILLARMARI